LEGLHCKIFVVNDSLSEVDTGKISFANFFNSLIQFVKSPAFHDFNEDIFPVFEIKGSEEIDGFRAVDGE
jgi:hypothetical protein